MFDAWPATHIRANLTDDWLHETTRDSTYCSKVDSQDACKLCSHVGGSPVLALGSALDRPDRAPQTARVERGGEAIEVPVTQVRVGETMIVRPGEYIPVDGQVIVGQATINQSTITGESMPVEAGQGTKVFAATIAIGGSLRLTVPAIGADTTFGKVMGMVEEAELHRADVQRIAD